MPRFHTERLVFCCRGSKVLHLFIQWLSDGLPSFCLGAAVKHEEATHWSSFFWCLLLLAVGLKMTTNTFLPHCFKYRIFMNPLPNWLVYMHHVYCSFDTCEWYFIWRNNHGFFLTTLSHIFWVLSWSRTHLRFGKYISQLVYHKFFES